MSTIDVSGVDDDMARANDRWYMGVADRNARVTEENMKHAKMMAKSESFMDSVDITRGRYKYLVLSLVFFVNKDRSDGDVCRPSTRGGYGPVCFVSWEACLASAKVFGEVTSS